jgi:hypothetical protein
MDQLDLFSDLPEPTVKDKEKAAKEKADRKMAKEEAEAKKAEDTKKSNLKQRPMISPEGNVFKGATAKDYTPQETAIARKAENEEFKDKRVKASPLVVEAELARMKEITAPKSKGGGGGGGVPSDKMDKMKKMNYKSGGTVKSSASKRADGCAIRGKTRA